MTFGILAWKASLLLLTIAVGFICRKKDIINEPTAQGMTNFLMKVSIPCLLITSVGTSAIDGGGGNLLYCGAIFVGYYIVLLPIMRIYCKTTKLSKAKAAVTTLMVAFPNIAFFGFPMMNAVLGPSSVAYGAVMSAIFTCIFFTYGLSLFQQSFDRKTLINPINIATLIMIILFATNVHLPEKLFTVLTQFGSLTTPLALLVIGGNIANSDLKKVLTTKSLYGITFTRLILIPVLFMACIWPLQMPDTLRMALLIGISCPEGALTALIAHQTNSEPEFAAQSLVQCVAFSVVTMPLLIVGFQYVRALAF
ncbi:MAG: AEC family transporter [Syntrophomonas sp.]